METLPGGRDILQLRGEIAPLLKLRELLGIRAIGNEPIVVIVETETVPRLAIAVDEIVGQQQVVVKNLESSFRRVEGVSAATIWATASWRSSWTSTPFRPCRSRGASSPMANESLSVAI